MISPGMLQLNAKVPPPLRRECPVNDKGLWTLALASILRKQATKTEEVSCVE